MRGDPLNRRERRLERTACTLAQALDPHIVVSRADGELFEGPVILLDYPDEDVLGADGARVYSDDILAALPPLELQELHLQDAARQLTDRGLLVLYVGKGDGIRKPFVEICVDESHHRSVMTTLATAQYHDDGTLETDDSAVAEIIGNLLFRQPGEEGSTPVASDNLGTQLADGAREGVAYLREALRTGTCTPELVAVAQFLITTKLAYDRQQDGVLFAEDDEDEDPDDL